MDSSLNTKPIKQQLIECVKAHNGSIEISELGLSYNDTSINTVAIIPNTDYVGFYLGHPVFVSVEPENDSSIDVTEEEFIDDTSIAEGVTIVEDGSLVEEIPDFWMEVELPMNIFTEYAEQVITNFIPQEQ